MTRSSLFKNYGHKWINVENWKVAIYNYLSQYFLWRKFDFRFLEEFVIYTCLARIYWTDLCQMLIIKTLFVSFFLFLLIWNLNCLQSKWENYCKNVQKENIIMVYLYFAIIFSLFLNRININICFYEMEIYRHNKIKF